jgi:hypothetical protein
MGANVFLSYASADKAIVERVAQKLRSSGIDLPVLSDEFRPGDDLAEALRKALQNSDAVVVVLSDASVNSAFVMAELGAAMALNKRIIPIQLGATPLPISLPSVSKLQILNAEGMSADDVAANIRDRLTA